MTRSLTVNENHEASSKKKLKTCENNGPTPWSDLNPDMLFLVIMKLGVVDFLAFSGVCKSWRSFSLNNKSNYILSRPPISIRIPIESNKKDYYCYIEEFDKSRFKTILLHSAARTCVGFTCGYLILYGRETRDFWLVNLITRHELHFPDIPCLENDNPTRIRAILVYSPSISGVVFVVLNTFTMGIYFSVVGTGAWTRVTSAFPLHDLYAYKRKIYIITRRRLCELRLDQEPKVALLETKNYLNTGHCLMRFVCLGETLYVMGHKLGYPYKLHELDLDNLKWLSPAMIVEKYDFFVRDFKYGFAIKPESWTDPRSQYERHTCFPDTTDKT